MRVVEKRLFLGLVQCEKLPPLLLAHLIHASIRNVGDRAYVVYVFLSIEIMRVPRLACRQPERLGHLTQTAGEEGHGIQKNQMLQLHTRSVRKVSDRICLCEHLMDYNLARLHEPTLNLSAHA